MMKHWIILLLFLAPSVVFAVPTVEYRGVLQNGGVAVNDQVTFTFFIYDEEAADVPVWMETHEGVLVQNGEFTVLFFSHIDIAPTDLGLDSLYLGISVDGVQELLPRHRLNTGMRARVAATALDVVADINPISVSIVITKVNGLDQRQG